MYIYIYIKIDAVTRLVANVEELIFQKFSKIFVAVMKEQISSVLVDGGGKVKEKELMYSEKIFIYQTSVTSRESVLDDISFPPRPLYKLSVAKP